MDNQLMMEMQSARRTLNESPTLSVLLVDDQPIVCEAIKGMLKDQPDIKLHYCSDPSKAIQMAIETHPTVILQDLIMPDIDGLMLVSYFRANAATKDIPLIVLSSKDDPVIKANGFRMGANDYMVKLPDRIELIARIRYHSEAYIRLLERNEAYRKLEESQNALNAELAEAASYVKSLLPKPLYTGDVLASWRFLPSTQLGGDGLGYQWVDNDHFIFYVFDVCGHGVGAALLSISVINMLQSQSVLNADVLSPSHVLDHLNASFPMEKSNEMFFTIWYGVYNRKKQIVTYACGGHPPAVLVCRDSRGNKTTTELKADGPVIGATPNAEFKTGSFSVEKGDRLYLFSDGIYEVARPDGIMLLRDEFVQAFRSPSDPQGEEIDRILTFSKNVGGNVPFVDDVTILELILRQ